MRAFVYIPLKVPVRERDSRPVGRSFSGGLEMAPNSRFYGVLVAATLVLVVCSHTVSAQFENPSPPLWHFAVRDEASIAIYVSNRYFIHIKDMIRAVNLVL